MTRRMLSLFSPMLLAAQEHWSQVGTLPPKQATRIPRPKNGQCPVCGTMYEPFRIEIIPHTYENPPTRRVDCDYCGCTFRQWAEGKEPKR